MTHMSQDKDGVRNQTPLPTYQADLAHFLKNGDGEPTQLVFQRPKGSYQTIVNVISAAWVTAFVKVATPSETPPVQFQKFLFEPTCQTKASFTLREIAERTKALDDLKPDDFLAPSAVAIRRALARVPAVEADAVLLDLVTSLVGHAVPYAAAARRSHEARVAGLTGLLQPPKVVAELVIDLAYRAPMSDSENALAAWRGVRALLREILGSADTDLGAIGACYKGRYNSSET